MLTRELRGRRTRRALLTGVALVSALALSGCASASFVPYAPTADLVPPLDDEAGIHLGSPDPPLWSTGCNADKITQPGDPGPNASEWRAVTQADSVPEERYRIVWFRTQQFPITAALDAQMNIVSDWFSEPCQLVNDPSQLAVEPVALEGLPAGAVTAHWPGGGEWASYGSVGDAWSAVIGDRDRRIMMVVIWAEYPDAAPSDVFVDVVNTAWGQFQEENSP